MLTNLAEAKNYNKPYYTIEFSAIRLGTEIRVNDIPIFDIDNTGFMTSEIPINEYLIQDNNSITIITYPLFDDDDEQMNDYIQGSSIDISIYVRNDSEPVEKRHLIEKVSLNPYLLYENTKDNEAAHFITSLSKRENNEISIIKDSNVINFPIYGVYKKQVEFKWDNSSLISTLPKWEWQSGLDIEDNENNYNSLLDAYKDLHNAFSTKNLTLIKEISSKRSSELAIAYYLGNEKNGFDYSELERYINHKKAKLHNQLYTEDTKLEILAKGKLARITDGAGNQPVVFVDDSTGQIHASQFMWYMNKVGKWILIR